MYLIHKIHDRVAFGDHADRFPLDRISVIHKDGRIAIFLQFVTDLLQPSESKSLINATMDVTGIQDINISVLFHLLCCFGLFLRCASAPLRILRCTAAGTAKYHTNYEQQGNDPFFHSVSSMLFCLFVYCILSAVLFLRNKGVLFSDRS